MTVLPLAFLFASCKAPCHHDEHLAPPEEVVHQLSMQPDVINKLILANRPHLLDQGEDKVKSRIRSEGLTFLVGRPLSDFPELTAIAVGPFVESAVPDFVGIPWWRLNADPSAQYVYLRTNVWKLTPSIRLSDVPYTDELILTVIDGVVVDLEGRAVLPY